MILSSLEPNACEICEEADNLFIVTGPGCSTGDPALFYALADTQWATRNKLKGQVRRMSAMLGIYNPPFWYQGMEEGSQIKAYSMAECVYPI